MTDLQTRITNANPATDDDFDEDGLPSFSAVWLAAERVPIVARRRPQVRFVRTVVATPRGWVALASTAGAAVVATLVLSAGTAPSVAQAFPILTKRATDLSGTSFAGTLGNWLPAAVVSAALQNAHAFSLADGNTGYVIESPDASTLCMVAKPNVGQAAVGWAASCGPTAYAEQHGMIASVGFVPGDYDFYALVPVGGSVQLTDDGSTTMVPIVDGIASGVVHDSATVTLQVGGSTQTRQIPTPSEPANDVNGRYVGGRRGRGAPAKRGGSGRVFSARPARSSQSSVTRRPHPSQHALSPGRRRPGLSRRQRRRGASDVAGD